MEAPNNFQFQFKLHYCDEVEHLLYKSEDSPEHVVQFKSPTRAFCLQCCSDVAETKIKEHIESEKHARNTNTPAYDYYHRIFMEFKSSEQMEQIYFEPFDADQIYCEMCETPVICNQVMTHIMSKSHKQEKKVQESRYWSAATKEKPTAGISYNGNKIGIIGISDDIAMMFYPKELAHEIDKENTFKFPIIQRTMEYTQCLICKIVIPGSLWSTEILDHINTRNHELSMLNKLNRNDVKYYHKFWAVQPANVQLQQYKFGPHRENEMFCLICRQIIVFDLVAQHSLQKCKYGEEQRLAPEIDPVVAKEVVLEYDPATINALYSNYNTMKGQRRPDVYFMQKRSEQDRFCLFCLKSVFSSPADHSNGRKHLIFMDDPDRRNAVNEYHRFWMSKEPDVQLIQVHFTPMAKNFVKCLMCCSFLSYKQILNHTCLEIIKKLMRADNRIPEDLRCIELKYHDVAKAKFYSHSFMETTKRTIETNMAVGLHFLGRIHCLICHQKIVRDMGKWYMHLMKHRGDADFIERIHIILQYHKYFIEQPLNIQLSQMQFYPKTATTVVCHKKHEMTYDRIPEHAEGCKSPHLNKLLKTAIELNVPTRGREESPDPESEHDDDATNNENEENIEPKNEHPDALSDVHTIVQSVENPGSNNPIDLIPLRFSKQKEYFTVKTSESVHCQPCNELIQNKNLPRHLAKHWHAKMYELWRFRYECDICKNMLRKEIRWIDHFLSTKHTVAFNALSDARKMEVMEYECLTCKTVIYGDKNSLLLHLDQKWPKKKERKITLRPEVRKMFSSPTETDRIATSLVAKCEIARRNDTLVKTCLEELEKAIGTKYPGCKAYPFGSRVTGIGKIDSDLDAFMDIGDMYLGQHNQDANKQQDIVLKVRKILADDKANFSDVLSIASARTPIVRVIHKATNIDVDLSFRHGLSVENTKYISFCLELQPIAKEAMLLLKEWAEKMNLKEHLTSYALCMMFIFYMQRFGFLLSVEKLRELTGRDFKVIDGWETINYTKSVDELRNYVQVYKGSVYEVLQNFFNLYKDFPFETDVVCPLLGRTFPVCNFDKQRKAAFPEAMLPYEIKTKADADCYFKIAAAMCVQDPFDLGHNLTKATQKSFVTRFKTVCSLAGDYMLCHGSGSS